MQDLIDDIIVWQRQTFPNTTVSGTLRHLGQELIEFLAAYHFHIAPTSLIKDRIDYESNVLLRIMNDKATKEISSISSYKDAKDMKEEIADIQILLIQLADTCGVNLSEALEAKMKKNNIRRWSIDENEIAQHVEDTDKSLAT